jgi:hypothetical protein
MIRKLAFVVLAAQPLPAYATPPAIPVIVVQPDASPSLEIYAVSASTAPHGIRVSGRVRRPITSYGHVRGDIVAVVTDGANVSRQFEGISSWPKMSNRGPRAGSFSIFVPIAAPKLDEASVTVAFRGSR